MSVINPKLSLNLNKGKHRMVRDKGLYIFGYIYLSSVSNDRDALYPDSGPIMDSKEGVQRSWRRRKGRELMKEGCL